MVSRAIVGALYEPVERSGDKFGVSPEFSMENV
jgi:hypothetical protein